MNNLIALIVGGAAGTVARYALSGVILHKTGMDFPYSTLFVNLFGCFLVGFLDVMIERKFSVPSSMRIMLITGFCGAFTTFSAYIVESYLLIKVGSFIKAFIYLFGSIAFGLIFFRFGILAARIF